MSDVRDPRERVEFLPRVVPHAAQFDEDDKEGDKD